ncbi:unnamed protein product [Meloidogyne enterolobii]|uniref:Uncharacterized protein n=1 Tax=Meloidogyne enterolobii TaxID=390850 RepID=A0ACB1AY30_MELEN
MDNLCLESPASFVLEEAGTEKEPLVLSSLSDLIEHIKVKNRSAIFSH